MARTAPTQQPPPRAVARAIVDLQRYFAGERIDFSGIDVNLEGIPPFYVRGVYAIARGIGWGETATYGELAARAGSPGAARGVGQALSRNPVAVIIPCHRILASGNEVGAFLHSAVRYRKSACWRSKACASARPRIGVSCPSPSAGEGSRHE